MLSKARWNGATPGSLSMKPTQHLLGVVLRDSLGETGLVITRDRNRERASEATPSGEKDCALGTTGGDVRLACIRAEKAFETQPPPTESNYPQGAVKS